MKILFSLFQWLLTALVVAFVLLMASPYLPIEQAVRTFTVRSGSMEPIIHTGSVIFVHKQASYQKGDIITIQSESGKQTVTHRIVDIHGTDGGRTFVTKGDANEDPDTTEAKARDVIGRTIFSLPYLGYPVAYAQTKNGFFLLIGIPAVLIILGELLSIVQEIRSLFRKRREKKLIPPLRPSENMTFSRPLHTLSMTPRPPLRPMIPTPPVRRRKIV